MHAIEELLCDFESAFDCKITVHDFAGIFHDADGKALLDLKRHSHRTTFLHCSKESRTYCMNNCMYQLNKKIHRTHKISFIKHCRHGVIEVVAPLYAMQTHVGTLFAGIWRPRQKDRSSRLKAADPLLINRLCRILPVFGYGLLAKTEFMRSRKSGDFSRKAEIKEFISRNFSKEISLDTLSKKIGLSKSRTCHLVREIFRKTFIELLLDERLEHARQFLIGTDYRMNEIADFAGFGSAEHFSRMFRKYCEMSPGEYRRRYKLKI
jgi:AraC family transcriptional regulator